jgi:hypothetical protein
MPAAAGGVGLSRDGRYNKGRSLTEWKSKSCFDHDSDVHLIVSKHFGVEFEDCFQTNCRRATAGWQYCKHASSSRLRGGLHNSITRV